MTLSQIQTYIVGVLQGWFKNKSVLDKFSETEDGKLMYNGVEIGSTQVTDEEVEQAVDDTLINLDKEQEENE